MAASPEENHSAPAAPENLRRLLCRACGCVHRPVTLAVGETARCVRCDTPLGRGGRATLDRSLAFALTGLILAVPAFALPFVTVSKLANERVGVLFSGVGTLWDDGMRLLSAWVLVCGGAAPIVLLAALVTVVLPLRLRGRMPPRALAATVRAVEHWAMPEVQVLAVLVALVKLHTLVNVRIGTGFWCYVALSFMTLLAWRSFEHEATLPGEELAEVNA